VQNFQIFIVFAVKICKQCMQTALVWGGGLSLGAKPENLNPTGGLPSPDHLGYSPK